MSATIESAIAAGDWPRARRLVRAALRRKPQSHWLITRLALTYYEQRRYEEALRLERRALRLAPSCPLVLWDYAGTLQMLDRDREAIRIYRKLVERGVDRLALGPCGEGRARSRGLIADSHYRIFRSYAALGKRRAAIHAARTHLSLRGPGCHSIYSKREVVSEISAFARRQ